MGLYPINCPTCGKGHLWWSGSFDTRCADCINANPIVVTANLKACGHEPCKLNNCQGCVHHCPNAIIPAKKNKKKKK